MMARAVKQVQQQQNGTGTGTGDGNGTEKSKPTGDSIGHGTGKTERGQDENRSEVRTGKRNGVRKEGGKGNGIANGEGKGQLGRHVQTARAASRGGSSPGGKLESRPSDGAVERSDDRTLGQLTQANGGHGRSNERSGQSGGKKGRRNVGNGQSDGHGSLFGEFDKDEEDDEATLEEEEQLASVEGAPGRADELAMLEEENSLSIDELLERIRAQAAGEGAGEKTGSKRKRKGVKDRSKAGGTDKSNQVSK